MRICSLVLFVLTSMIYTASGQNAPVAAAAGKAVKDVAKEVQKKVARSLEIKISKKKLKELESTYETMHKTLKAEEEQLFKATTCPMMDPKECKLWGPRKLH